MPIGTNIAHSRFSNTIGDFKLGRILGQGAFCKVRLGMNVMTGERVAIKVIPKDINPPTDWGISYRNRTPAVPFTNPFASPGDGYVPSLNCDGRTSLFQNLEMEVKLLMRLNHPNIIKIYNFLETKDNVYIVMQLAKADFIDYFLSKGRLPEQKARVIFRQLLSALHHCHASGICHRDLKLDNLLLDENKNILLTDFGLSKAFYGENCVMGTFCGTPLYTAPEIASSEWYNGKVSDVWSLGVILFIIVAGEPPFNANNLENLYKSIRKCHYLCPSHFSKELVDLFKGIFVRNPNHRITLEELMKHSWTNIGHDKMPEIVAPVFQATSAYQADLKTIDMIYGISSDEKNIMTYQVMPTPGRRKTSSGSVKDIFEVGGLFWKRKRSSTSSTAHPAPSIVSNATSKTADAPTGFNSNERRHTHDGTVLKSPVKNIKRQTMKAHSDSDVLVPSQIREEEEEEKSNSHKKCAQNPQSPLALPIDNEGSIPTLSMEIEVPKINDNHIRRRSRAFSIKRAKFISKKSASELFQALHLFLSQRAYTSKFCVQDGVWECFNPSGFHFKVEIYKVWLLPFSGLKFELIAGNEFLFDRFTLAMAHSVV